MGITAADEAPRAPEGDDFSDAVTFAFGDPEAGVYGIARVGLSSAPGGAPQASGLAIVFDGHEAVAVRAAGGIEVGPREWAAIDAAGVKTTIEEPLAAWTVTFTGEDGAVGFELRFEASAEPSEVVEGSPVADAGGMHGYEHLCRVTGSVTLAGGKRQISCLGQRGHSWGAPDWSKIALARSVSAWIEEDLGVSLTAVRPSSAKTHADEAVAAAVLGPAVVAIEDARLSTTYDSEGRQRRASMELYENEDAFARRLGGDVICGTSLDLGQLRLDCAFFAWQMEGRSGVGRYDILRKVA